MPSILLPGEKLPKPKPLYARSGWLIPVELAPRLPPAIMELRAEAWIGWKRGLEIRSEAAFPYNCMGLVFANRRAWIEIDYIYDVLREDGYHQIRQEQVKSGDIVLYKDEKQFPVHVGLIIFVDFSIGTTIRVISKWGLDPEFYHFMDNVPFQLGKPTEFWTDRIDHESR